MGIKVMGIIRTACRGSSTAFQLAKLAEQRNDVTKVKWNYEEEVRAVREKSLELYPNVERTSNTHDRFIRQVQQTGVTLVTKQAREHGFGQPDQKNFWANFGQGAPECGPIP